MNEPLIYHRDASQTQEAVLGQELHPDDADLVARGEIDEDVAKALRHRRAKFYANEISGPVHDGRLSRCTICAYAPPSLTTVPLTLLISVYVIQFYEKVGASLGLLAFFQALGRAFDVITDPTMSYVSDSCRSKHGRRRPFLATGAPFYCVCLICLLFPQPHLSEFAVSVWFGFFYIAFFLFSTYCNIPYDALGPELTDNQNDRSLLFFTCTLYDGLGALLAACLPVGVGQFVSIFRSDNSYTYDSCNQPGADGQIDALSASGPWAIAANGRSTPPPSVRNWVGYLNQSAAAWGFNETNCTLSITNSYTGNSTELQDLHTWCECRAKADVSHGLDTLRYAYFATGLTFGLWALIFLLVLVFVVRERSQIPGGKTLQKPRPLVPSILNTLSNKPFTLLLPAWILDSLANAIIGSLLTFFVRYVVKPEFSNQDTLGCRPVGGSTDWRCDSDKVLGASVVALLMGAFLFTPFWLLISKKLGKRNTWLLWSLTNGLTFLCYSVVGAGDVTLCVVMSVFNGAPIGAKFLADAIMADVIDYDEFLTGARAEATYTMFKGFLPKIAAIPASAVPIVLLSTFGHVKPIDGVLQPQPDKIVTFIRVVIIYIPAALAFGAFLVKLRFPLRTQRDNDVITEGISKHLVGKAALDPCSEQQYRPVDFNEEEIETVDLIGSFPGVDVTERLLRDVKAGAEHVKKRALCQLVGAIVWLISFASITGGTFYLLMSDKPADQELQVVPVLSIVGFGIGITLVGFTTLRFRAASKLLGHTPSKTTIKKLLKKRRDLAKLRVFDVSIFQDCRKMRAGVTSQPEGEDRVPAAEMVNTTQGNDQ